jgi:hypothetical protein
VAVEIPLRISQVLVADKSKVGYNHSYVNEQSKTDASV